MRVCRLNAQASVLKVHKLDLLERFSRLGLLGDGGRHDSWHAQKNAVLFKGVRVALFKVCRQPVVLSKYPGSVER